MGIRNQTDSRFLTPIFRPSARADVHHSLFFFLDATGAARQRDEEDPLIAHAELAHATA